MQFINQETTLKNIQVKKRTISANFNSKKIKNILTTRQTCDEIVIVKQKQTQQPPTVSSKTLNYHRKGKSFFENFNQQPNMKKSQNKTLLQIIKPIKYEKTKEQNLLIKNCNKSKLIYWSKDIKLQGREKYLLISADLLIDQDCFWDKFSTDNGHTISNIHNNNFSSVNYNSTTLSRNRNGNPQLPPKFIPLNNNIGSNYQKQSKRNPLMNTNWVNFLVRQWKNLHNKIDGNNRKIVVLWFIRKQSTYGHLVEFAQTFQLPLHGIFYVKRKRTNSMFDLGHIVKEIHHKFFESIVNPFANTPAQKQSPKTLKSIQKNTDFKRSKSRQMKRSVNKLSSDLSIQLKSNNNVTNFTTHKFMKFSKQSNIEENDQNCGQNMNLQTCKQFQLSKNTDKNKKPLISIIMDEKRVKRIIKKANGVSQVIKSRHGGSVKISQPIQKIQTLQNSSKRYMSPLITDDDKNTKQIQQLEQDLLQMTDEQKQQIGLNTNKPKYIKPQIFVFEGVKCNLKDYSGIQTYEGKMPLVFGYHQQRYREIKERLENQGIEIVDRNEENETSIKVFYFKYESIKQNVLQRINNLVREIVLRKFQHKQQASSNNLNLSLLNKFPQYISQTMNKILGQYQQQMRKSELQYDNNNKSKQSKQCQFVFQTSQQQQLLQLTQEQQQLIQEKTQRRLQQIKKQLINDVITMKGRNYTFQNGQSVYYYVGGVFKRNYNLLYSQYYTKYENQLKTEVIMKNQPHSITTKNHIPQHNQLIVNQNKDLIITIPKLSQIQFFEINNSY